VERKIPVYGALSSTWPVASGVLVENGVAYAAAGIAHYDGTHVYALDAATGRLKWQNNTTGSLDKERHCGVSVQGHLLFHKDRLYLAGGNQISPAVFDPGTGKCLSVPSIPKQDGRSRIGYSGRDLCVLDGQVVPTSRMSMYIPENLISFYADLLNVETGKAAYRQNSRCRIVRVATPVVTDGKPRPKSRELWQAMLFKRHVAAAAAANALVLAGGGREDMGQTGVYGIAALAAENGKTLWAHKPPAAPVRWGLAVDRTGRVFLSLKNGQVLCYGKQKTPEGPSTGKRH
jgi:outer membrane protein assembly factor BamB